MFKDSFIFKCICRLSKQFTLSGTIDPVILSIQQSQKTMLSSLMK